ncbi:cell wall hydrolase [Sphingomonas sp. Leaf17]|nr:cell wall hydrolase [Sphingomonas sp. Leaf17]
MTRRRLAAAGGLVLASGLAMSAHAALRAMADQRAVTTGLERPTGYEAQDHFPGAALLYADQETRAAEMAAPAAGVTGTIALPAVPVSADRAAGWGNGGVVAAAPFSSRAASAVDRGRALECLTAAIYYEAASEPDAGQQAVAQVILNRVRHPAFPATVCGVVYQGSERSGCQFSFACDGAMSRVPARSGWMRAARAAAMALAGRVYAPVGLATHYHTYAVTPAWNRSLVMTDVVGAHFFHRWKGYWGTASAFHQRYLGNEPVPGPHRAVVTTPVLMNIISPLPIPAAGIVTAPPVPQRNEAPAETPSTAVVATDNLPPASQILDRWKDSGKPIS